MRDVPRTLPELCHVVQGLIVHPFHAELYGLDADALRQDEVQIRSASAMLDRIFALDPRPLSTRGRPSAASSAIAGTSPCSSARSCAPTAPPPARAAGSARYFESGQFVDHWVGEVWDEARGSWRLVDAQLDALQRESHRITFDPLDVPRTQFLVGGDAWQRCRRGSADPERFGILDMHGLWFVLQNLVRDLAARAKRELLPWDGWGLMLDRERYDDPAVLALLDRVAELTQAGDERHAQVLALHDSEPTLRVPRKIVSFGPGGGATVDLGPGVA